MHKKLKSLNNILLAACGQIHKIVGFFKFGSMVQKIFNGEICDDHKDSVKR